MNHEWQSDFLQQGDARIFHAGAVDDDAIHASAVFNLAICVFFALDFHHGQVHIKPACGIDLARAGNEVAEDRVADHFMVRCDWNHVTNCHCATCCQAFGAGVWLVVMLFSGLLHADPRVLRNFGIAVQCTAHRRLAEVQQRREFF